MDNATKLKRRIASALKDLDSDLTVSFERQDATYLTFAIEDCSFRERGHPVWNIEESLSYNEQVFRGMLEELA